jgi:hypothetical protein
MLDMKLQAEDACAYRPYENSSDRVQRPMVRCADAEARMS